MAWINDKKHKIKRSELFSLLEYHQRTEIDSLKLFGHHLNVMIGLITAIFAASTVLIYKVESYFFPIFLAMPTIIGIICYYSRASLDRYYRRFLEAIVIKSKIEFILGISSEIGHEKLDEFYCSSNDNYPFKDDISLLVDRNLKYKNPENTSSTDWIVEHMGCGHNGVFEEFMLILFLFSFLIPLAAFLRAIDTKSIIPESFLYNISVIISILFSIFLYILLCIRLKQARRSEQGKTSN